MRTQRLSEKFIEKFANKKKWQPIASEELSKKQLKTFEKESRPFDEDYYWKLISKKQQLANAKGLSPMFIEKHQKKLDWTELSHHQHLPMPLIYRHAHQVDWTLVTRHQVLSERFIEKYSNHVEWETISFHQSLSERFINRYYAKMNFISAQQKRSESFLFTHFDKLDAASILEHQQLVNVKKYEPFEVYILTKGDQKKYILKFHKLKEGLEGIRKVDEEELYDHLEEAGLLVVIEEDFPELTIIGDNRF